MTEHADAQAGRLVDALDTMGIRDNTLVFYIWGDNGSSVEGQNGSISELLAQNGIPTQIKDHLRALEELGGLDALGGNKVDNMYHAGWAWAGSTPFQATKLVASHFGGTRTPMAVSWPRGIQPDKATRTQFHHVNDIVPTIYDVAGVQPPGLVDGVTQEPLDGLSMRYTFADATAAGRKKTQYFEVMGSRAIYQDGWIASVFGPRVPWVAGLPASIATWSPDQDTWELYDLGTDFSQATDVAAAHPDKVAALKQVFRTEALANRVDPVGGGLWSILHPQYAPRNPATTFHYNQDVVGIPEFAAPKVGARSNLVTMDVDLGADATGVLYALGAVSGGVALWVDRGRLHYEYNLFEITRTRIDAPTVLPTGRATIEVESRLAGTGHAAPMDVVIRVDGREVAKGRVPMTAPLTFTANDAFDVGIDSYSPVSLAYFDRAPFKYNKRIGQVTIRYL